jgi:hypothetical protein
MIGNFIEILNPSLTLEGILLLLLLRSVFPSPPWTFTDFKDFDFKPKHKKIVSPTQRINLPISVSVQLIRRVHRLLHFGLCCVKVKTLCLDTTNKWWWVECLVLGENVPCTSLIEVRAVLDMMAKRKIPAPAWSQTLS